MNTSKTEMANVFVAQNKANIKIPNMPDGIFKGNMNVPNFADLDMQDLKVANGHISIGQTSRLNSSNLEVVNDGLDMFGSSHLIAPKLTTIHGSLTIGAHVYINAPRLRNIDKVVGLVIVGVNQLQNLIVHPSLKAELELLLKAPTQKEVVNTAIQSAIGPEGMASLKKAAEESSYQESDHGHEAE